MTDDALYEPLGRPAAQPVPARRGAWRGRVVVAVVLGGAVIGAVAWAVLRQPPPNRGVVVAIAPPAPVVVPRAQEPIALPPPAAAPPLEKITRSADEVDRQSGVTIVRPPGSAGSTATFIKIPNATPGALAEAPDPRLVEQTRYGRLPRLGADGARAAEVYARPLVPDITIPPGAPRIAIVVGGMGLNSRLTSAAAAALPPDVSFGFAPYGGDLERQVQGARAAGHEALLQVPMESFDAPDGTSMPRMLTTDDGVKDTLDRLSWQMSRFTGYAGVANFLGAKFTADAKAFGPVLRDVGARGLFFFDDGSAPRSLALALGPKAGVPTVRADVVIDALGDPNAIAAGLQKLERLARDKGTAIASTTGLPTAVDQVAAFARGLAGKGIALVPVSSLVPAGVQQTP